MAADSTKPSKPLGARRGLHDRPRSDYSEEDFKARLSDEYKLLQDKLDKIGAFRFTIKGWSITAILAGTITATGRGLAIGCIVCLGLFIMLLFFLLLEYEQAGYSRVYGERARRIEDAFTRIRLGKGREMFETFAVPHTAHDLAPIRRPTSRMPMKSRTCTTRTKAVQVG